MRKVLLAIAAISCLFGSNAGAAIDPVQLTGTIDVGNPVRHSHPTEAGTMLVTGYSEANAACAPADEDNGLDGVWFALDPLWANEKAVATFADAHSDGDVYFYTAACAYIPYTTMAQNFFALGRAPFLTNAETGKVPANAAFVLVHGFAGKDIRVTLTIGAP